MLVAAVVLGAAGLVLYVLGRMGIGRGTPTRRIALGTPRLPGDFSFGGRNWRVYMPLGTSLLLSVMLTLLAWVVLRLRR